MERGFTDDRHEDMKIDTYYGDGEESYKQRSGKKEAVKYSRRSPPRKQWRDTDHEDTDAGEDLV